MLHPLRLLAAILLTGVLGFEAQAAGSRPLYLCFGSDISELVVRRIAERIRSVAPTLQSCANEDSERASHTTLVFGNHPLATELVDPSGLDAEEGYRLERFARGDNLYFVALGSQRGKSASHFAAYALLEALGFRFLHPLQAFVPAQLSFPEHLQERSSPRWPQRRWHLHTQHPLELTNLLNAWGETPEDKAGFEAMLPEWDAFLEWAIANRQNQVSWYLLMAKSWQAFADSPERQERLRTLVERAQAWGLKAGFTAPLAFKQQHSWTMIRRFNDGTEIQQIQEAVDWLAATGVDFLEVEMGFSEFTHPDDQLMMSWLNAVTRYAKDKYGISVAVKVHSSTGQVAKNYADPETGGPLNFNFLPYYADPDLAVMPHTVQVYGLDDPAPTYGNKDFSAIKKYMGWEAGRREVLFYPETAYWVSYDIDVPLFLPIYAERRLRDLREIARLEDAGELGTGAHKGSRIDGQVNFSSGWEWAYWLNEVITARAAWDPLVDVKDDRQALRMSLAPVTSLFGDAEADVAAWLVDVIQAEEDLLIFGKVAGVKPSTVEKRNGQAYVQGFDAWDDIPALVQASITQPKRLGLIEMRNPFQGSNEPHFVDEISPLLGEMRFRFEELRRRADLLAERIPSAARGVFAELQDSLAMTSLRATQVYSLHHYVSEDAKILGAKEVKAALLASARASVAEALVIADRRAQQYRVPRERIDAWQEGPTAYHYGYLWTVKNLMYWRRDEAKALLKSEALSPCYLNIVDPLDIGFGWDLGGTVSLPTACLKKPTAEPTFP